MNNRHFTGTYLIDNLLPQSYLASLGRYVQTCAHAEHAICSVICKIEGRTDSSEETRIRHNELRLLSTKELITELSKAGAKCENEAWKEYFKQLAGWLHQTIDTRHLAIHGRHYFDGQILKLDAPTKNGREVHQEEITDQDINDALNGANVVLNALLRFLSSKA